MLIFEHILFYLIASISAIIIETSFSNIAVVCAFCTLVDVDAGNQKESIPICAPIFVIFSNINIVYYVHVIAYNKA